MADKYVPHLRLSYGGVLGTQVPEVWSNTVRWNVLGAPPSREQLETACDALVVPLRAWMNREASAIHGLARLSWIKLNWVLATGLQRDVDTVLTEVIPAAPGGRFEVAPPYYQTFAVTLRTRVSRGRGHAGRVFPPMVVMSPVTETPYTTPASATGMAESYITMLREARTAMGLVWQDAGVGLPDPGVFSAATTSPVVRPPTWTAITGAVVDRVPDVQHRRTNRVPRSEGQTVLLDP